MIAFLTILIGLVVGSFLNVCIYRMPEGGSIISPRSYCPSCKHPIVWYDNIPVLSFILLKGRCRYCNGRISLRYPVVEITTAVTLLLLVTQTGLRLITIIYAILCCGMIVATFVDLKHSIIPDEISYGGIALGIILSIIYPKLHNTDNRLQALFFSIAGILVGGALIYSISAAGSLIFRKKLKQIGEESAMGGGDIKYLAMIGAFLGYKYVLFVFFLAPLFGSIVGIIMKLRYKAEIIPYGPYLSLATLVVILWGERIWRILYPYL